MTFRPCSREKEVAELLARGHFPLAYTPELHAHLGACRSCADLVLVTQAFQSARASAAAQANLPSPSQLWWRAQLRRRNEAVERVGKPILGAQIFALSVSLVFAVGFLASQATQGIAWLSWLKALPHASALHLEALMPTDLVNSGWSLMVLIPVLATFALLGGVAVYLASEKQ
jgi:hypothetical protein